MFTALPSRPPTSLSASSLPDTIICFGTQWPALVKAKDTKSIPLGNGQGFVFVFTPSASGWSLSSDASWLAPSAADSGEGYVSLAFEVQPNAGSDRKGAISANKNGQAMKTFEVHQFGSQAVQTMKQMVLDPPLSTERGKFPPFSLLIMELGILGKFVAKEIRQAPAVAWEPLVLAAAAVVEGFAQILVAGRMAFYDVPEPPDYFSSNPMALPMETELIESQSALLSLYIQEQVFAGG